MQNLDNIQRMQKESLERLGTFAVIGVVSCCGPSKDDNKKKPDPGPLGGTHQSSSTDIA